VLKVKHIMVVGHLGCGGVHAALTGSRVGLADNWILHVRDALNRHARLLDRLELPRREDAACKLNVLEQARNVCNTTVIRDAWARDQRIAVHGMVYSLANGRLHSLDFNVTDLDSLEASYATAVSRTWQSNH
jgi:carbonic anhydrase